MHHWKELHFLNIFKDFSPVEPCWWAYVQQEGRVLFDLACILATRFDCILPMEPVPLLVLPEIGTKKVAVVLLACGIYNKMGLGPGVDTHVLILLGSLIECMCCVKLGNNVLKTMAEEVARYLPVNPGIFTK